jgi:hypothetical protein
VLLPKVLDKVDEEKELLQQEWNIWGTIVDLSKCIDL